MTTLVTLSSRLTFCYKVIFSITWISGFGLGTVFMWMSAGPPVAVKWSFLVAWCLGSIVTWRTCVPLKRLRTDGRNLYVSNYLKEIAIPVNLIDRVTENRWINIHPVTIHFRGDTEFGSRIVFMPKSRFAFSWTPHPVVGEIERLAQTSAVGRMT
jgi:hypothetical protein